MRICVIGYRLTPVSGHIRGFFEVARLLEARGLRLDIVTDFLNERSRALLEKVWQGAGSGLKLWESGDEMSFARFFRDHEFEAMLRQADLVHAFDLRAVLFIRKFRRTRDLNVKILYSVSTFPILDRESLFTGSSVVNRIADPSNRSFLKSLLFPAVLLPWVYSRADHIIAACEALKDYLVQNKVPAEKVDVIYPPVNTRGFPPAPVAAAQNRFRIAYYGWLSEIRGVSSLLEAFQTFSASHPEASLVFSTPDSKNLEARVLAKKIRESGRRFPVELIDFQTDVSGFLDGADLVVLPFRGRFGYLHPPLTLLETIFKRKVFLTTPLASIRELIHEKDLLVDRGESLAERMADVRKRYDYYQGLVNSCADRVMALVSLEAAVRRHAELYERLAAERSRERSAETYSRSDVSETYDSHRFSTSGGRLFDRLEKAVLLANAPTDRGSRILEVGSGSGRFVIALAGHGYRSIAAADASEPLLNVLKSKVLAAGLAEAVTAVKGDIYRLDFQSASFDFVYAIRVLNQLGSNENRAAALRELMRVVKPGGALLVDIVNRRSLASMGRASELMRIDRLEEVVHSIPGFRVEKYIHRLSFSQTLLEKVPTLFTFAVYAADLIFSRFIPFFGTRVYVRIRREAAP